MFKTQNFEYFIWNIECNERALVHVYCLINNSWIYGIMKYIFGKIYWSRWSVYTIILLYWFVSAQTRTRAPTYACINEINISTQGLMRRLRVRFGYMSAFVCKHQSQISVKWNKNGTIYWVEWIEQSTTTTRI